METEGNGNQYTVSYLIAEKEGSALPERMLIYCNCIICDLHTTYIAVPLLINANIAKIEKSELQRKNLQDSISFCKVKLHNQLLFPKRINIISHP